MQSSLLVATLLLGVAASASVYSTGRVYDHLCTGKDSGEKVATNTCNAFVTCHEGVATLQNCEQGKLYDSARGECDWAGNVHCEEWVGTPQGPAPNCQGRVGQMLRNPYDCSSFYFCEHNAALLMHCDSGLYFDSNLSICNWKENVQCRTDIIPTDPSAPDCIDKDWMYFPNYVNCGTYYRCENSAAVLYSCPEGLLFDPLLLTCNWAPSVKCY